MHNGVHFADVAEEFVAETFPLRCAFDQPGDIHELDCCGDNGGGFGDFGEWLQTIIGDGHDADIRIDGAKGIVGRLRVAGAGYGIKQGGLANIWQPDNSGFEHKIKNPRLRGA